MKYLDLIAFLLGFVFLIGFIDVGQGVDLTWWKLIQTIASGN